MNFEGAVQALTDDGVDFIVIGDWSAVLHGCTHNITNVVELFTSSRPENLNRLARALAPFHPRLRNLSPDSPFDWDSATLRNETIVKLATDLGPIDLVTEVHALSTFEEVKLKSISVEAFGRRILTLDLASLIQSKRAGARDKDIDVIRELESLSNERTPHE